MNKILKIAAAMAMLGVAAQAAANEDTFTATVELQPAITLDCDGNLDFGTVYRNVGFGTGSGTVTVAATASGDVDYTNDTSGGDSDRIQAVTGGGSVSCQVTGLIDERQITLSGAGGNFDDDTLEGITLAGPDDAEAQADVFLSDAEVDDENTSFYIGGVLSLDSADSQENGQYTSEAITVTVVMD